jgi:hypothetical protein
MQLDFFSLKSFTTKKVHQQGFIYMGNIFVAYLEFSISPPHVVSSIIYYSVKMEYMLWLRITFCHLSFFSQPGTFFLKSPPHEIFFLFYISYTILFEKVCFRTFRILHCCTIRYRAKLIGKIRYSKIFYFAFS